MSIDEEKAGRYLDEIRSLHAENDRLERELAEARSHTSTGTDIPTAREQELIAEGCDLADALDKYMRERDEVKARADAAERLCASRSEENRVLNEIRKAADRRIAKLEGALRRGVVFLDGYPEEENTIDRDELLKLFRAALSAPATDEGTGQ